MATHLTSPTIDALINKALAIEDEQAQAVGALGFMARAMVQATLPHKKVVGNEFERRNGNYTLTLLAPSKIGLPYGTIPRLLLAWLTTEAVKTQSRELELGDSLSGFMRELDMVPTGGRWGIDLVGLKNLMAAVIRFEHPENEQALLKLIDLVNEISEGNPELKRTLAIWIRAVLLRQSKGTLALPKVRDLKELKMTLAERFETWAQQHEKRGIERGEALPLQRQLVRRFGALPTDIVGRIAAANSAQLEVWGDRVLDADSLEEVFAS